MVSISNSNSRQLVPGLTSLLTSRSNKSSHFRHGLGHLPPYHARQEFRPSVKTPHRAAAASSVG